VVRLAGDCRVEALRITIESVLQGLGLTNLRADPATGRFDYDAGACPIEVRTIDCSEYPIAALVAEIERQINTQFVTAERFSPFRFFVVPAADGFFLGLVYFHVVADAESVVQLLRDIIQASARPGGTQALRPVELYPDHRTRMLLRHPGIVIRRLLGLAGQIRRLKHSIRPHYGSFSDQTNGFTLFAIEPEAVRALRSAAKTWSVTVNDLLLALLLKSLSPSAGARVRSPQRKLISLGCVVNLRPDLDLGRRRVFGLFLGTFATTHGVSPGVGLRELAGDVARQTLAIKRNKLYLGTALDLGFARFMLKFLSPERRTRFYPKNHPLWGGITNLNVNSLWPGAAGDGVLDYIRAVSTGPATPLVLSATTIGDRMNIGLSWRTTVFSAEDVAGLKSELMQQLKQLKEPA
jgi:hypothetical protein